MSAAEWLITELRCTRALLAAGDTGADTAIEQLDATIAALPQVITADETRLAQLESEVADLRAQLGLANRVNDAQAKEIKALLATNDAQSRELKSRGRLIEALSDIHGLNAGIVELKVRRGKIRLVVATSPGLDEQAMGKACADALADALEMLGISSTKWEQVEP